MEFPCNLALAMENHCDWTMLAVRLEKALVLHTFRPSSPFPVCRRRAGLCGIYFVAWRCRCACVAYGCLVVSHVHACGRLLSCPSLVSSCCLCLFLLVLLSPSPLVLFFSPSPFVPSLSLSLSLPQPEQSQELPLNNLRRTTQSEFGQIPVRCPELYAVGCCLETLVNLVFGVAPSWVLFRVGLLPFSSRGLGLYAVYGVGLCLDLVGGVVPCHREVWAICRTLLSDVFCVPRFPKVGADLRLWPRVTSCPECVRKVVLRF